MPLTPKAFLILIIMKTCFKCNVNQPLTEYYKHKKMGDGHLNKCKTCTKKDTRERELKLISTPHGLEKERARHREKYYRLEYRDKHNPTPEQKRIIMDRYNSKYPEKRKAKNSSQRLKPLISGNHLHHWSYNEEHYKDVIELSESHHNLIHRFLTYNQDKKMYIGVLGSILNTREKHIAYANSIINLMGYN